MSSPQINAVVVKNYKQNPENQLEMYEKIILIGNVPSELFWTNSRKPIFQFHDSPARVCETVDYMYKNVHPVL